MAIPFFGKKKEKPTGEMPIMPEPPSPTGDEKLVISNNKPVAEKKTEIRIDDTPVTPAPTPEPTPTPVSAAPTPASTPAPPAEPVSANTSQAPIELTEENKPVQAPDVVSAADTRQTSQPSQTKNVDTRPQDIQNIGTEEKSLGANPKEMPKTEVKSDSFYIDLRPKVIKLPPFEQKRTINVRYPLIAPFAYAHIHWDPEQNELLYDVEEPLLDETEKEMLELIHLGLEEMINISFVRAAKSNIILQYLEKNVQSILVELGTKVSKKTYQKLMYYIYRDSVGLNEIEPLLNDYYVEDIECNGVNFPLYIVHRTYQNLKTNVIFKESSYMTDFVEKLAQKTGRYISYAKPLLDGTLPDGSRVNATYTEDITTRGPTFTIRKFTKEPWTPIHLIQSKTASAESFAFMWMVIEHKFNVMVVGETASGKTTFLNCIVDFIPPEARICSIEDTRELNLAHINWLPAVTRAGFGMPTVLGTQYGEITLFDLLRESFRQNPDYVIVGEIRGKESYVLFQGMASGHPSFSTFHAASVETVVKRLETPPISLSPSLVEALDVICICIHVKDQYKNVRKLKEIDEMLSVEQALGQAKYNPVLKWDMLTDVHTFKPTGRSRIFERIKERTGLKDEEIIKEFARRAKLLNILSEKNIVNFEEFNKVVNDYYKDPDGTRKKYGIS